jgi:hypothetical protein
MIYLLSYPVRELGHGNLDVELIESRLLLIKHLRITL